MLQRAILPLMALVSMAGAPTAQGGPWIVGRTLPELTLPSAERADAVALRGLAGTKLLLIEFASW